MNHPAASYRVSGYRVGLDLELIPQPPSLGKRRGRKISQTPSPFKRGASSMFCEAAASCG